MAKVSKESLFLMKKLLIVNGTEIIKIDGSRLTRIHRKTNRARRNVNALEESTPLEMVLRK